MHIRNLIASQSPRVKRASSAHGVLPARGLLKISTFEGKFHFKEIGANFDFFDLQLFKNNPWEKRRIGLSFFSRDMKRFF